VSRVAGAALGAPESHTKREREQAGVLRLSKSIEGTTIMNAKELPQYKEAVTALTPVLYDLPGRLIAIDGESGVGKTTLGRYLAWQFNITLVESKHVITRRLDKPRPVIVEAVAARRLLRDLAQKPDYVIYVTSGNAPESRSLKDELASYEIDFKPATSADMVIDVSH
jgi:ABC-type glutathione transport system ATPase component